ncbi:MAG: PTS sugar transporter subunit IIA [Deltaproteobacteria bacterium]|nr:PTS sugar transporter subunit IIA [Deltaproteobacteria bacterium]
MNAILAVSILVTAGLLGGSAARRLHLPSVTGNIVAGIIIGPYLANLLTHEIVYQTLKPISEIALSLIAVSIASHLKWRRMAPQALSLFAITLGQALLAMLAVYLCCNFWLDNWVISLLLATIAASTAPAATLSVIRETEADGPLVKNLLSVVALDNVLAIVFFVLVSVVIGSRLGGRAELGGQLLQAGMVLGKALLLGISCGALLIALARRLQEKAHFVSLLLMVVCFSTGLSLWLKISPLLPNMVLGFIITNFSTVNRQILTAVEDFEPFLYVCFFTLAGTHLDLSLLPSLGAVGTTYIVARYGGKLVGAGVCGWLSRAPRPVGRFLGFCLAPQAGVAIGLVVALQENPLFDPYEATVTAIILASIVVSELFGPVIVKEVLKRAGETGKAGHLLFGIAGREAVTMELRAPDKWALLKEMVAFAGAVYKLPEAVQVPLLHSVIERERSLSTGLGKGIAIPHGTLAEGLLPQSRAIMGVVAVIREGVEFNSLDGQKASVIILMIIPEHCFADHLKTLAAISKVFSRKEMTERVIAAASPHEVYHLIFSEEMGELDYLASATAVEAG